MAKKRRSREFKNSSQVIDIEEARKKRQEKRKKSRGRVSAAQAAQEVQPVQHRSIRQKAAGRNLVYLIAVLIMLAIAGASVYNIISLKQDQKQVQQEQRRLEAQKTELEEELRHLEDPDYVEEQARAQLRLVMPGESIYVFPKTDKADNAAKGTETDNEKD